VFFPMKYTLSHVYFMVNERPHEEDAGFPSKMDDLYVDGMAVAKIVCHSREHLTTIVTTIVAFTLFECFDGLLLQAPYVAEV
jgi:hypothetical protein